MYTFLESLQIQHGRNKIVLLTIEQNLYYEPRLVELAELPWGKVHVTR